MVKKITIVTVSLTLIILLFYVFIAPKSNFSSLSNSEKISPAPSASTEVLKEISADPNKNSKIGAVKPNLSPNNLQPDNLSPAPDPSQKLKVEQVELELLKKLNKKEIAKIKIKMHKDEVESLKKSIINDQQALKIIEKSGSNIETYKLVESNLHKRKLRLKELLR